MTARSALCALALGTSALTAGAVFQPSAAQAAPTTFLFNGLDKGLTTITKAVDGITLTISSFVTGPRSGADSDGLAIYCVGLLSPCFQDKLENYDSFLMTFDKDVQLLSYNVRFATNAEDSTTTYSQGVLSSVQVNSNTRGTFLFNNQFTALANVPIQVSTFDNSNLGTLQINQLTVEEQFAPSPEHVPGPLPVLGAGAAFGFSRRLRRRISASQATLPQP
jgi:hypothetical protein